MNVIPLVSRKFFLTPCYYGLSLLRTVNRGREGVRNEVSRWGYLFFVHETKPLKLDSYHIESISENVLLFSLTWSLLTSVLSYL